jgi:cystathionine beta-synthase
MPRSAEHAMRATAPVFTSVLDMIGNTPMLELTHIDTGPCQLFVKFESLNPGNSIKDRIALYMINQAERDGLLKPGGRLIEATAGNTGIALAVVAAQRGYKLTVVVPDKMSPEKISHLRALGADVILTRTDVTKGHPEYYADMAQRIARENPDFFYTNQFENDANVRAHYETTGPEIWRQLEGNVDAVVAGVGSGGTITGAGRYLREQNPDIEIIVADPAGSVIAPLVNEGKMIEAGSWLVEGVGEDFVPIIADLGLINRGYSITDAQAFEIARELLHKEGVFGGSSTGVLVGAALRYCREQTAPKRVVTFVCDHGSKYLSKMFNDYWMMDQGFAERKSFGDLRDLIARRHTEREDYTVGADMPLSQAVKTMRLYDISQMVVLDDNDNVTGIIDESDVLMAMAHSPENWQRPVSDFMTSRLETVPPSASINDLMPVFRADRVAIVADDDKFYGLVTKIDLINYLRKRMPK